MLSRGDVKHSDAPAHLGHEAIRPRPGVRRFERTRSSGLRSRAMTPKTNPAALRLA